MAFMEKKVLEQIYKLRKIKPEAEWKERTLQNILQEEDSLFSRVLPAFSGIMDKAQKRIEFSSYVGKTAGVFALTLLFFAFSFPVLFGGYEGEGEHTPINFPRVAKEEEDKMVSEKDKASTTAKEKEEPEEVGMDDELASMEDTYRQLQFEVLSTRTGEDNKEEIADALITEVEEEGAEEMISVMESKEEDEEEDGEEDGEEDEEEDEEKESALEDMKDSFEEEDYDAVLDTYIKEL